MFQKILNKSQFEKMHWLFDLMLYFQHCYKQIVLKKTCLYWLKQLMLQTQNNEVLHIPHRH